MYTKRFTFTGALAVALGLAGCSDTREAADVINALDAIRADAPQLGSTGAALSVTPPSVSIASPLDGATLSTDGSASVEVVVSVDGLVVNPGAAGLRYYLDGVEQAHEKSTDPVTLQLDGLGLHHIAVHLVDKKGQPLPHASARAEVSVQVSDFCQIDADCDDGRACSTDRCDSGQCAWQPVEGCCDHGLQCPPGVACADNVCGGCVSAAACDDGSPCTIDECVSGYCVNLPDEGCCVTDADCSSTDPCRDAYCWHHPKTGAGKCREGKPVAGCCQSDDDCSGSDSCVDGSCTTPPPPAATPCTLPPTSTLVLNEVMVDPSPLTSAGQWIELYNPSSTSVQLDGWTLATSAGEITLPKLTVAGRGYLVVAASGDQKLTGGLKADGVWSPALALSGAGGIELRDDSGATVDVAALPASEPGRSLELANPWEDNDDEAAWWVSGERYPERADQYGSHKLLATPGASNRSSFAPLETDECPAIEGAGPCVKPRCGAYGLCVQWQDPSCCTSDDDCEAPPCQTVACDADSGTCKTTGTLEGCCVTDADCDDGNPCNVDQCAGGQCQSSGDTAPGCCQGDGDCDDGNPCTTDACDLATGECSHGPATGDGCCASEADCDDGDSCTIDSCGAEATCVHTASEGCACSSDAQCPAERFCDAGICRLDHALGEPCGADTQCATGTCAGGTCGCPAGATWSGSACEVDDPCEPDPCVNGTCSAAGGEPSCACQAGYTGAICAEDIDECTGAPCQNGGTCQNEDGGFSCDCPVGYGGAFCEVPDGTSCDGVEAADDGVDSDCDGVELFGPTAIPLSLSGSIGAAPFEVTASGSATLPFLGELALQGDLVREVADGPVTWCLTATLTGDTGLVSWQGATFKACRDAAGQIEATIDGDAAILGATAGVTADYDLQGDSLAIVAKTVTLAPMLRLSGATFTVSEGGDSGSLSAQLVAGTGDEASLAVSGTTSAGEAATFDVTVQPGPFAPFAALNLGLPTGTGTLTDAGGAWTLTLISSAEQAELGPGALVQSFDATVTVGGGIAEVALAGDLATGPFWVPVSGSFAWSSGASAPVGCLETTTATAPALAGLATAEVTVSACLGESGGLTIGAAGAIDLGFVGEAAFTGVLTPASPWSLTLTLSDAEAFGGLATMSEGTLVLTEGGDQAAFSGQIDVTTLGSALSLLATGQLAGSGDLSLELAQIEGDSWAPLPGFDLTLTDLTGSLARTSETWSLSITGSSPSAELLGFVSLADVAVTATVVDGSAWTVGFTGQAEVGPFDVTLAGDLAQDEPGDPITGCLSGSLTEPAVVAGLTLDTLDLSVCQTAEDTQTVAIDQATGSLLGSQVTFSGLLQTAPEGWELSLTVAEMSLLGGWMTFTDTTLTLVESGDKWAVEGTAALQAGPDTLTFTFTGLHDAVTGALSLSLTQAPGESWTPIDGFDLVLSDLSGTIVRASSHPDAAWSTTLKATFDEVTPITGLTLTAVTVTTTFDSTGAWAVGFDGDADVGPLEAHLSGILGKDDPDGPITGCLGGAMLEPITLAGVHLESLHVNVCIEADGTRTTTFDDGEGTILGQPVEGVLGTVVANPVTGWQLTVSLESFDLAGGVAQLTNATLTMAESGAEWEILGTVVIDTGVDVLSFDASGAHGADGSFSVNLTQSEGADWQPFAGSDFALSGLAGGVSRTASGTWTVGVTGNSEVGPFDLSLTAFFVKSGGEVTFGCLQGELAQSETLAGVEITQLSASVCKVGDTVTVTLDELTATILGQVVDDLTGTLTLGEGGWTLQLGITEMDLADGVAVLSDATLTMTESGAEWAIEGTIAIDTGADVLTFDASGTHGADGSFSVNLTQSEGTTWQPFAGSDFTLSDLAGGVSKTAGGTWTVGVTGTSEVGPFDLSLTAFFVKSGGEITFGCLQGELAQSETLAGVEITQLSASVCQVGDTVTITLNELTATILGQVVDNLTGTLTLGEGGWTLELGITEMDLADGVAVLSDATLTMTESGAEWAIEGTITIDTGADVLSFDASGTHGADGSFSVNLTQSEGTEWQPFAGSDFTLSSLAGGVSKTAGGTWTVGVTGTSEVGPFDLSLTAFFVKSGGEITFGCLQGELSQSETLAGVEITELSASVCKVGDTVTITLNELTATILGQVVDDLTGTLTLGEGGWTLELGITEMDLADGVAVLSDATLTMTESGSEWAVEGTITIDTGADVLSFDASGTHGADGSFSVNLTQSEGTTWQPFAGSDFTLSSLAGGVSKTAGGTWTVGVTGTSEVGPFDLSLTAFFVKSGGEITFGCLQGELSQSETLAGVEITQLSASVCQVGDTVTITLNELTATILGQVVDDLTGTLTLAEGGWTLELGITEMDLADGVAVLSDATLTMTESGAEWAVEGTITIDTGADVLSFDASGTHGADGSFSVNLTQSEGTTWQPFAGSDFTLSNLAGGVSKTAGGTWTVGVTGTSEVGPFDLSLTAFFVKSGDEITFGCLQGELSQSETLAGVEITQLSASVCQVGDTVTITLNELTATILGQVVDDLTGTLTLGEGGWTLELGITEMDLADGVAVLSDATLTMTESGAEWAVEGTITIDTGADVLSFDASGTHGADGSFSVNLTQSEGTTWQPFAGSDFTLSDLAGGVSKTAGGTWTVGVTGTSEVGPFDLSLTAFFVKSGGEITFGCLQGELSQSETLAGVEITELSASVCQVGDTVTITLNELTATVLGQVVDDLTGTLTLGEGGWTLELGITELDLADGVAVLSDATLTMTESGAEWAVEGTITIDTGADVLSFDASGTHGADGSFSVNLTQSEGTTWQPFAGSDFTLSNLAGGVSKTAGGTWTVGVTGTSEVGPFDLGLTAFFVKSGGEITFGCLQGELAQSETLAGVEITQLSASVCQVGDTVTITLNELTATVLGQVVDDLTGTLTLGEGGWTLELGITEMDLADGVAVLSDATLTMTESGSEWAVEGTITIETGADVLSFDASGTHGADGSFSVNLTQSEGTTWQPFAGSDFTLSSLAGGVSKTAGGTWTVGVTGTSEVGQFDLGLTAFFVKSGGEITFGCLQGELSQSETLAGVEITQLSASVCKVGDTVTITLNELTATVLGQVVDDLTGTLTLGSDGWTLELGITEMDLADGVAVLSDATLTMTESGSDWAVEGTITIDTGSDVLSFDASGTHGADGSFSVNLTQTDGTNWQPFAGSDFTLSGLAGGISKTAGGTWTVGVTGTNAVGPFDLSLTAFFVKSGDEVTFGCLQGELAQSETLAGVEITQLSASVCKVGDTVTVTLNELTANVLGQVVGDLTGTLTLAPEGWTLELGITEMDLADGVAVLSDATLTMTQSGSDWAVEGTVTIDTGADVLSFDASGTHEADGSFSVNLTQTDGTTWQPFEGSAFTLSGLAGGVSKTAGGSWIVGVTGTSAVGPFDLSLTAFFVKSGGEVTFGCLEGQLAQSESLSGVEITQLSASVCKAGGAVTVTLEDLTATILGQVVDNLTGTLTLGSAGWTLQLGIAELDLADGVAVLSDATLTMTESGSEWAVEGTVAIDTGADVLSFDASGAHGADGSFSVNLTQTDGTTWQPFAGSDFTLSGLAGGVSKTAGGTWTVGVTGTSEVGPFDLSLTAFFVKSGGEITFGCLEGELAQSESLVGVEISQLSASVCKVGETVTITLNELTATILGQVVDNLTGTLTLGSDGWTLDLGITEMDLADGVAVLSDATLTMTEAGSEWAVEGTVAIDSGVDVLSFDASGTHGADGSFSVNLTQSGGTSWQPFEGSDFTLSGLAGGISKTAGGTWTVGVTGTNEVGPFDLGLTAFFVKSGGEVTFGCLEGELAQSESIAGVQISQLSADVCKVGDTVTVSLTELTANILGQVIDDLTGTLTLAPEGWTLELGVTELNLAGDVVVLSDATLTMTESGVAWEVGGKVAIDTGADTLTFDGEGEHLGDGSFSLALTQTAGETWQPFAGMPLTFDNLGGLVSRSAEGDWAVTVSLGTSNWTLAPGVTLTDASAEATFQSGGVYTITFTGEADFDPFGAFALTGTLSRDESGRATGCLSGSFAGTGEANLGGVNFPLLTASVCFSGGDVTVNVNGELVILGDDVSFEGALDTGASSFSVSVESLDLTPQTTLHEVTLTFVDGTWTITGRATFGTGAQKLEVIATGLFVPGGDYALSLSMAPGTTWKPLPGSNLTFDVITGTLTRSSGVVTATVTTSSLNDLELVSGLTLRDVTFTGTVASGGAFSIGLNGAFDVTLGGSDYTALVSATVDSTGDLTLQGMLDGIIEPFPALLGDTFTIRNVQIGVQVSLGSGSFAVGLSAEAWACIRAACTADADYVIFAADGQVSAGASAGVWFRGSVDQLEIPKLGQFPKLVFVASSYQLNDFDLFDTPMNPDDDVTLYPGLAFAGTNPSPVPLGQDGNKPSLLYIFTFQTSGVITAYADVPFDWDIIKPANDFPGIEYATLSSLFLDGEVVLGEFPSAEVAFGANVVFQPTTQLQPLTGTAAIEASLGPLGAVLALQIYLDGRWYEPLGLEVIAIENPGMEIGLNVSIAPPLPQRIGFNGDLYWNASGSLWPDTDEWPENGPLQPGEDPPLPPEGIKQVGGTFYVDLEPSPSGLCLLGKCAPLPTFLFRLSLANLSFPGDLFLLYNGLFATLQSFMPGSLPNVSLPPINTDPISLDINQVVLYASTHNFEFLGQDYRSGLLTEIDATIATTDVSLTGFADTKGIFLEGRVEPINLFGADMVKIVGDPFRHYANLGGGGYIQVPDHAKLDLAGGTIEGWVKPSSFSAGKFSQTLVSKHSTAAGGYRIGIGAPDDDGLGRVSVQLTGADGSTTTVTTDDGWLSANTWHHVAAIYEDGDMTIAVDGLRTTSTPAGDTGVVPAGNGLALKIGQGTNAVDDVRLWTKKKTLSQLRGEWRFLSVNQMGSDEGSGDPDLVARYEFDYDPNTDDGTAHNTRYWIGGPSLHGTYQAGSPVLDTANQDIFFKLALRLPGTAGAEDGPGLWAQAGIDLDLPILKAKAGAQIAIGAGAAMAQFYMPDFMLIGTLIGDFILGGYGPNLVPADFDDGLFGQLDILDGSFAITGKLGVDKPNGEHQVLGGASASFLCPENMTCGGPADHVLDIEADLNLTFSLGALGSFGIQGEADVELNTADWFFQIDGSLVAFGLNFFNAFIELNADHLTAQAAFNFGSLKHGDESNDLGELGVEVTLTFGTWELCAKGGYANDGGFTCELGFCLGGSGFPVKPVACCGGLCTTKECCDEGQVCFVGVCKDMRQLGESCAKNTHCVSGYCGCFSDGGEGKVNVGVCYEPGTVEMGEDCKVDAECITGRCSGVACATGKCVCDKDSDCGPGYYCDQGIVGGVGTNSCKPKKADGVTCTGSNKCLSGYCSTESESDPCGYCYTPSSGGVGDDCRVDAECVTDRCGYVCGAAGFGKCKCDTHSDCGSSAFCRNQLGGDNLCEARRADFEGCNANYKCLSGHCSGGEACVGCKCYTPGAQGLDEACVIDAHCSVGKCSDTVGGRKCVCDSDDDCGSGYYCAKPVGGVNHCEPKKSACEVCDADHKCKSGHCTASVNGKCIVVGSESLGESCCHNDQCDSGKCEGGTCVCNDDLDCPSGEWCFTPAFGSNFCAECKSQSNGQCNYATEYCDGSGTCRTKKANGSSCSANYECKGTCGSDGKCYCQADNEKGCGGATPQCKNNSTTTVTDNECVECTLNTHCSGAEPYCGSSDNCVECKTNSHCGSNEYCGSGGSCLAKKSNGSFCTANDQCVGTCGSDNRCYCEADNNNGCSGSKPYCKNNNFSTVTDNECVECHSNSQCSGSQPYCGPNDTCVRCTAHSHCNSNQYCNGSNYCSYKKYEGSSCSSSSECYANCVYGKCRCNSTTNNGCPSSEPYCLDQGGADSSQGDNYCVDCKNNSHCYSSQYCSGNNCVSKKNMGAYCTANYQCKTGNCEGNDCVCANDADCHAKYGSAYDCIKPVSGKCGGAINFCKRTNSDYYCE